MGLKYEEKAQTRRKADLLRFQVMFGRALGRTLGCGAGIRPGHGTPEANDALSGFLLKHIYPKMGSRTPKSLLNTNHFSQLHYSKIIIDSIKERFNQAVNVPLSDIERFDPAITLLIKSRSPLSQLSCRLHRRCGTGVSGSHHVNDTVWYPRFLLSPFLFSTPHEGSIPKRLFASLMSYSISLSCPGPFELASTSECGEFLLRRNPKLMVNYIRPVTELGLERARRSSTVSSIRKIAESVEARTFPDTRPVGKRSPLSRMTLSLGVRVHERSGIRIWLEGAFA
uniref:Uncharacterized protein n=1 Tax=Vespula pensylvanica TaxID=30213 RepID=A0A834PFI4_VESPE|nr:hypothetical protein H0235_001120 [Vespula pensylvanica]